MRDLEDYKKEYQSNYGFEHFQVKYRQKKVLEQISNYKPQSILEVGCGTEALCAHIAQARNYVVVEPIAEFVEIAKKQCADREVTFITAKLEDAEAQLSMREFDFVIVSSLIHELENPSEFIKIIRRLCNKKSIVHINTPNALSLHRLLGREMGLMKDLYAPSDLAKNFQRHHEFDLQKLSSFIISEGFEILDQGSYFIKPLSHAQMQKLLDEKKISEKTLDGFDKMIKDLPDHGAEIFVNARLA